jgi:UDP-N-acetylglucosamine diphosphorylase/glucosamine-1-phosphate N-acetyltransferase
MNPIVLFEDEGWEGLLPLVYWRSVFELRLGRKIAIDRIAQSLGAPISGVWTRDWIAPVAAQRCGAPANVAIEPDTVLVNGRWLMDRGTSFPDAPCVGVNEDGDIAYIACDAVLAKKLSAKSLLDSDLRSSALAGVPRNTVDAKMFRHVWDLVSGLSESLTADWCESDAGSATDLKLLVDLTPANAVRIGERASIHPTVVIDATSGPIFISDDVEIGAFTLIEGPAYIGPGTRINPHARLHGGVAIGPVCRIGGEVCGSIVMGYTNKQHDGFLGHAFVGNWVNIGAGAVNSNLKNTYGTIRASLCGKEVDTGVQFFGVAIADHVKIGINTTIPTGAMIGFASTVSATGDVAKYTPSFSWVTQGGVTGSDPARALDVATTMMTRRNIDLTDQEVELFMSLEKRTRNHEARA